MKAAVTGGKGDIKIIEAPVPEAKDYRCLCKISACATCSGTDLKIINNELAYDMPYPSIVGHESVGRVVEKGNCARYIEEGDYFLRPTAVYPGEKLGDYFSTIGCFAEYGLVTDVRAFVEDNPGEEYNGYARYQQKIPVDLSIPPADATMLVTLKEIASFLANAGVRFGSSVLVLGTGPVAKSMCFFARLFGAYPVVVAGRREEALEWVKEAGIDHSIKLPADIPGKIREATGDGVDFVLDSTGVPDLVVQSLGALKEGGKAVPYATYPVKGKDKKELFGQYADRIVFAGPGEDLAHNYLLELVRMKVVGLSAFYTHTMPLEKIEEGFELLRKREAQKVVFEMQ